MDEPRRAASFKWRHFASDVFLCAVRWYLRYSLSYREVQELLVERGLELDHTTDWRWVQRYAPELEERTRPHLKPTNKSWRVDETYVRVKGRWFYLYRAIRVRVVIKIRIAKRPLHDFVDGKTPMIHRWNFLKAVSLGAVNAVIPAMRQDTPASPPPMGHRKGLFGKNRT